MFARLLIDQRRRVMEGYLNNEGLAFGIDHEGGLVPLEGIHELRQGYELEFTEDVDVGLTTVRRGERAVVSATHDGDVGLVEITLMEPHRGLWSYCNRLVLVPFQAQPNREDMRRHEIRLTPRGTALVSKMLKFLMGQRPIAV